MWAGSTPVFTQTVSGDPTYAHLPPSTLQVAGAVSSLFILIIIVKLGELFQDLPKVSSHTCPTRFKGLGQAKGSDQSGPR